MLVFSILKGTPWWVWMMLGLLLWRGIHSLKTHTVSLLRIFIIPLVFTGWSVWGFCHRHPELWYFLLFILVILVGIVVGSLYLSSRPLHINYAKKEVTQRGSWLPLIISLLFFAVKYGLGLTAVLFPHWAAKGTWCLIDTVTSGLISGVAWGRCLSVIRFFLRR